jgi:hypothetical protein
LRTNNQPQQLRAGGGRLVTVMLDVELGGFGGMMRRMVGVPCGGVRMMSGLFMVARFMMPGGFAMMPGRVFVMVCCFLVMLCGLLGHKSSFDLGPGQHGVDCARLINELSEDRERSKTRR